MSTNHMTTSAQRTMWRFSEWSHKGSERSAITRGKLNTKIYCNQLNLPVRCNSYTEDISSIAIGQAGLGTGGYCMPRPQLRDQYEYCCDLERYFTYPGVDENGDWIARPPEDIKFPRCRVMIPHRIWWREDIKSNDQISIDLRVSSAENISIRENIAINQYLSNKGITSKIVSFQCI